MVLRGFYPILTVKMLFWVILSSLESAKSGLALLVKP